MYAADNVGTDRRALVPFLRIADYNHRQLTLLM